MSQASSRADTGAEHRTERLQHWFAVLVSALLHVLLLVLALLSSPVNVTPPQGTAGGSRMAVQFVGATPTPVKTAPTKEPAKPVAKKAAAKSRVQSTLVAQADDPLPPDDPEDAEQNQPQPPAPVPPATPQRRSRTWGQPPGMLQENLASENSGLTRSAAVGTGRRNDASTGQPSMEVGGYQVYYDLRSENRLRAWREQGMTEVFMPLPGTRRYMVCPIETAIRRESGPCRLLEPDSPELAKIGDAREGINMQQVYKQGEVVWRGPGPYR